MGVQEHVAASERGRSRRDQREQHFVDERCCKQYPTADSPRHVPQNVSLTAAHRTVAKFEQNNPMSHDGTSSYDATGLDQTLELLLLKG